MSWFCFKNVAMSVCCPLCWIRRKVRHAKGEYISSDLGVLYPATEISNPRFKFKRRWEKFSLWHLGITSFWYPLGSYLGLVITGASYKGLLFVSPCWGLLYLSFLGEIHQHRPYCAPKTIYGAVAQDPIPDNMTQKLDDKQIWVLQQVVGGVLYYSK